MTLDEAKAILRIDTDYEDDVIESFLLSAESLTMDVARLTPEEWDAVWAYQAGDENVPLIRGETVSGRKILHIQKLLLTGVRYALGYMNEHREDADFRGLSLTIRGIVESVREGVV